MARMVQTSKWADDLKPALAMVAVQVSYAGSNVIYKLAVYDGMNYSIIVAYRYIFATVFMAPLALICEREIRPKLTWKVLFQAFLCGLLGGSLYQNLYVECLALTSATFASAMANLIPAITFVLSVSFRLETLALATRQGQAKVMGTLTGIGGAMLLSFYKGPGIEIWSSPVNLLKQYQAGSHFQSRALGSLLSVAGDFSYALWLIVQAKMSETYPCPYSSTALMTMMASIQAVAFAFCMDKDWSQWKLGWNIRLFSVAFLGIVVAGLMINLVLWCVRERGPLFVAVFNPLVVVVIAFVGPLLLDEKLHLGSLMGAILIVGGLYVFLRGKAKEMKNKSQAAAPSGCSKEGETIA